MPKILIVEDEAKMAKLVMSDLKLEGFQVDWASDGAMGLDKASGGSYDLLILDVMMPKMDGYEVCRALRGQGSKVPIIMLSAKSQDTDKIVGFQVGIDDFLTKPFNILELIARVKALLRRTSTKESEPLYENGSWKVDFRRQEAWKGKERIALTSKEFQLLRYLIQHRDEVISREQFLRDLWQYDEELPSTRTVDNQIASLRRKLGWTETSKGPKILTLHNSGYRFTE